jgi:hypothetical protein
MKPITFARVLRALAIIALVFVFPGELENATTNIEAVFATEIVMIAIVILMTRIIEIQKTENTPQKF